MSEISRARSSLNAHARWALTQDRAAETAPARQAMAQQFEDAIDEVLPGLEPGERAKRVASLKSAYFAMLRLEALEAKRQAQAAPHRVNPRIAALAARLVSETASS